MKELFKGIFAFIGALLVSVIQIPIGLLYSFGYSVWLTVTLKKWHAMFSFWWRLIDGFLAAVGHAIYHFAFAMDMAWNVNGEILEDIITAEENTTFTDKNTTVSATVGKLEYENKLNRFGKFSSRILNLVFGQKQHALDSYLFNRSKTRLKSKFFK